MQHLQRVLLVAPCLKSAALAKHSASSTSINYAYVWETPVSYSAAAKSLAQTYFIAATESGHGASSQLAPRKQPCQYLEKNLCTAPTTQTPSCYMFSWQPGLTTTITNRRCLEKLWLKTEGHELQHFMKAPFQQGFLKTLGSCSCKITCNCYIRCGNSISWEKQACQACTNQPDAECLFLRDLC